jgi:transposase
MSFTGLVTSEHSSGASRRQGGIPRAGNRYLRHVLVQGAHSSREPLVVAPSPGPFGNFR